MVINGYKPAVYSKRPIGTGFRLVNPAERSRENPARAQLSPHRILAIPRVRNSPIWIQPRGVFWFNSTPGSQMSKNYAMITQCVLPLTTFYRSGAQRSNVYQRDMDEIWWRFHNRAWQPQRHDRLPETSGTLWIHRGALTNQWCSQSTGCGSTKESQRPRCRPQHWPMTSPECLDNHTRNHLVFLLSGT